MQPNGLLLLTIGLALVIFKSTTHAKAVVILDENNWQSMLQNEWMVEFYAPWCPACKSLTPTWNEFATWSKDLGMQTAKIDVTTSPGLSGRFFVTALPTIFHVLNGEFRQYRGSRDLNSLMTFIEDKRWQSIEPVSAWKQPNSIQMSIVSYFFKLSHFLKELNNRLLVDYGLPVWGSYMIFAIATIFLGAVLGLIFVCIIDFIFPPKMSARKTYTENKDKDLAGDDDDDNDIKGDELEDDQEEQSTSDGEKYSGTDSDTKSSPKQPKSGGDSPKALRKRKARKSN